jgi:hypothetical protein
MLLCVIAVLLVGGCGSGGNTSDAQPAEILPSDAATLEGAVEGTPGNEDTGNWASSVEPAASISATAMVRPDAPTLTDLTTFVDHYGYPESATFARLRVPRLGIEGQVGPKVVGGGAEVMPNPEGPADIVWYDLSEWSGFGGAPGAGGNAIFGAHVDYASPVPYAGVNYRGLGVFKDLSRLAVGDIVEIDYQGQTLSYAVVWTRQLDADGTDWASIWSSDVPVDSITLYTCGGTFDAGSRSYQDRVVVRAERI